MRASRQISELLRRGGDAERRDPRSAKLFESSPDIPTALRFLALGQLQKERSSRGPDRSLVRADAVCTGGS